MATLDSLLDADAMAEARALLAPATPRERLWPVLGAAGLLALSALVFAAAMITAPPLTGDHVTQDPAAKPPRPFFSNGLTFGSK